MERIYVDFAASTPTDPQVTEAMLPYLQDGSGNPSSVHSFGRDAAAAVDQARHQIAAFLSAKPDEIYFTSTGTESNNLAIIGTAKANKNLGTHIVTSNIEHPSVINACRALEREGLTVTHVEVGSNGLVDPKALLAAITEKTFLLTLHLANSEVGVIQDVAALFAEAKRKNPQLICHVDACQATPFLSLDVQKLNADLLTLNGSKAYGPKGVATLYVRSGVPIFPIIYGGGQEKSLRSGTENVPGIIGLAKALELVNPNEGGAVGKLRDRLQERLKEAGCTVNCESSPRLPNHLSVVIPKTNSTNLVADLDELGVAVSAGSACSSKSLTESHVLLALGLNADEAQRTIRISFGRSSTEKDCDVIVAAVSRIILN